MKILYAGDSPTVHTGFGIVSRSLLNRFVEMGHEIVALGVNHYGEPYDQKIFPYPIYPCEKGGSEEVFGFNKFWQIYAATRPEIIFFINDPWLIESYMNHKPENLEVDAKIVAYYPTDGGPLKPSWLEVLNGFDAQVCYSNFAVRTITESNKGVKPKNLYQIYHGVDTKAFFPVQQQLARKKLGLPLEAFIVGMVARNQYRKRFDLLMHAFAKFAKDKPEAKLYFHCAINDIGYDIIGMEKQYNLGKKLILTENMHPAHGATTEELNLIYNTFDVHALISLGDGFGLPVAESMATGCPNLVSGHSCLQELVEGHGGLTVKTAAWIMNTGGFNTWGGVSDVDDIVDKLELLYKNRDLRIKLGEEGYNYITQPQFSWDYIAEQFQQIFKKIYHIL